MDLDFHQKKPLSNGNVASTCVMWQLAVLAGDFLLARASVANATLRNFEVDAPFFSGDEHKGEELVLFAHPSLIITL